MVRIVIRQTKDGWQRFTEHLQQNAVGAREMARARFLVGTRLPYAFRWIELGERDDPRLGHLVIKHRSPRATHFIRSSVQWASGRFIRRQRGTSHIFGGFFNVSQMHTYAQDVADSMRQILNAEVYSTPVPMRGRMPAWRRTHALYNSIRAYRV